LRDIISKIKEQKLKIESNLQLLNYEDLENIKIEKGKKLQELEKDLLTQEKLAKNAIEDIKN
jgi:hypothetical protein